MTYNTMNNDVTLTGDAKPLFAGRYQVVCQLGSGGMGSVCLVEDTKLDNKLFAIKMLPAYLVANKRAYRQLQKEALVAMQLVHPNIVQIRDFVEHEGSPFLVMDYVEGQTLDDYIADKGTLTEEETVRLLKPIAAALDYAHGEGVVHRDIKPANVMIRKDGRPFILDFGIAREIQETMTRVTGKFSSGTLLYMSPEQLNGEPPSPAQDVYSFAVMAYECLKGAPPFVRGQIEHQILNNPPPPLPEGIGAALAEAVRCGLAKKKEDRPTSCCEIIGCCAGGIDSTTNNTRSLIQKTIMAFQNKDFERAFGVAQKADKNNAEIQYIIGMCYLLGNGTKMDEGAAMQWFRKAAVQGYSAAQNDLGNCYVNGRGVVKDEVEAIKWYRKAADHGYAEAQNNLGIMYWYGKGIERDDVVAASWFRKAAVQGYAEAQYNLGDFYYHGLGGLNDIVEAAKWYRKAAEQGHESAQELFCFMYSNGQGVEKDDVGAVKIVHNAAEQGHAYAQFDLGKMYYNGDGVTQNYAEAIKWYRKAAEQGDVCAQYNLGKMYSKGEGVAKNNEEVAMWLRKAA